MKMEILNSSTRKCRKLTRCPRIISSQANEDKEDIKSTSCQDNENGDDESMVLRVKLVLSRRQVRQLVSVLGRGGRSNGAKITPELVEKIQHVVSRKKHVKFKLESENVIDMRKWKPQLQSIPEEI